VSHFSSLLYGLKIDPRISLISFLLTFSVYNLNKVTDKTEDFVNRPEIASKSTKYFLFPSLAALTVSFYLCFQIGLKALFVLFSTFIIGFMYSVKMTESIPRLKEIVGVKSLMVALSWGVTGSVLPACTQQVEGLKIILAFIYIFIQLLVNTVLCDVRDMDGDKTSGMDTIPLVLGLENTKRLLIGVNSLLIPWLIYCMINGLFMNYVPALLFGIIYGYIIIYTFSRSNSDKLLVDLAVDGEWIPLLFFMKFI
jgi:4-hydroxybenzoate polyprenyltransferase